MATAKKEAAALTTATATKTAKTAVSNLALGSADDALTLAKELQKFVKDNKLTSNIQGKEFPNVEAWQFAGGLLGLSSLLESLEERSTDTEIKWQATVKVIHLATGNVVGRGAATCSNKESTKKFFADYAICSMAQTRAVGKAYRLSLGWLMKAAGYEATPAEEMSEVGTSAEVLPTSPVVEPEPPLAPMAVAYSLDQAVRSVLAISTREEQVALWPSFKPHVGDPLFDLAVEASKHRWAAPDYQSPEQAEREIASRKQRDFAHKLLASSKNDDYRLEALHLLADVGLSWAQASTLVDKAQANTKAQPARVDGTAQAKKPTVTTPSRPERDEAGNVIEYASADQKQQIIELLNHPLITRQEKTKTTLGLYRFDVKRANQAIAKLQRAIADREGTSAVAA